MSVPSSSPTPGTFAAYRKGDTPEQIAQDYSSLQAADIYAVIAYYLRHQDEVAAYLARREQQADAVRRKFQALFRAEGLRERLQSRLGCPGHGSGVWIRSISVVSLAVTSGTFRER